MNIWSISIKNIKSKPLYTLLSVIILALSITLLLGIQQLKRSFKYQMENNLGDIDMVIGAKGSPLQLILASVLHIDNPTGNISYNEAKKIGKNPMVKSAIPISYGDNYKGFRIVGTTHEYYDLYNAKIEDGREVEHSMEVVLGHTVAQQLELKIDDTILSSHGLVENSIDVHSDKLTVVGILKPTQKVIDRLIITNLESVWDVHNHEEIHNEKDEHDDEHEEEGEEEHEHEHEHEDEDVHGHDEEHDDHEEHQDHEGDHDHEDHHDHETHDEDKEITSLLVNFKSPRALLTLPRQINKNTNLQAALPILELNKLYEYTSVGFQTISWIAYLILIISCVTIFISLYKMVKERAFDLAILRTYGASNFQLIKMVVYEGVTIAFSAFLLGVLFVKMGLYFLLKFTNFRHKQNMLQELGFQDLLQIGTIVFIMITLSILLAIYPILKMNISTILSNEK